MERKKKSKKNWEEKYEKIDELGTGGNATVYRVRAIDGNRNEKFALKQLTNTQREKKERFINEINIMRNNHDIAGIIDVFDFSIEEYWYTMPIAKPAIEYISENNLDIGKIVQGTIQLSETLEKLHKKGVSHRDIKPSNIYYYKKRFCLGDFGLVGFREDVDNLTKSDKGLGAIFTIAPEMKRNPQKADGEKADVFSLAKTMWMFLTKDEKGFDGVYDYLDHSYGLRFTEICSKSHLVELEELLKDATDNNPDNRPTISQFKERLNNWLEIYLDIDKSQDSDWKFLNKQLFGSLSPESSSWSDINKITQVLNIVGHAPAYNHMFFHDGGGMDFSYAEIATENKCIKLYDTAGRCYVLKPRKLYFEGFGKNYKWDYFLLELDELERILDEYDNSYDFESLVEDSPAHYVSAKDAIYGVYNYETGIRLPKGYQEVYRYVKGKFLFVMKFGPYNEINATYDGRHGDCTADEFRRYTDNLIKQYLESYNYIKKTNTNKSLSEKDIEYKILNLKQFNENPFKKSFNENAIERDKKYIDQENSKEYVTQNFSNWNFNQVIQKFQLKNKDIVAPQEKIIKFIFGFNFYKDVWRKEFVTQGMGYYLDVDGKISEKNPFKGERCFYVYDRDKAIDVKEKLDEEVIKILKQNKLEGLEKLKEFFSIDLLRTGKPTHLFTKKEIEEEMRKADDRKNNQFVIDENGYAKVLEYSRRGMLYPVRHEHWDAGNNYVGKFSNLSILDNAYVSALQRWEKYLASNKRQYIEYIGENKNEEELIRNIKAYY